MIGIEKLYPILMRNDFNKVISHLTQPRRHSNSLKGYYTTVLSSLEIFKGECTSQPTTLDKMKNRILYESVKAGKGEIPPETHGVRHIRAY